MEEYVAGKLEDMKTRALEWETDGYPLAFQQQLKKQREEPDEEKAEASDK